MIKSEKYMINMVCLQTNKNNMKIWDSMETKGDSGIFLVSKILLICGVNKDKGKGLKIFSVISKTFFHSDKKGNNKDPLEERML